MPRVGIVDRERGIRHADDDRAGLLAFFGYGDQDARFRSLLRCKNLRQVEHPSQAGLVVENLLDRVLIDAYFGER
ncbi:hypothetical protein WT08_12010 [Burkholderia sp. MSMB1552]|nr:hypothetical protein WT08_12010 [Burkholderia sp. MSMB1552]